MKLLMKEAIKPKFVSEVRYSQSNGTPYVRVDFGRLVLNEKLNSIMFVGKDTYHRHYNPDRVPTEIEEGNLFEFETTEFSFPGSTNIVKKWTGVFFDGEDPKEIAQKELDRYNATILIDGNPYKTFAEAAGA